jgi:DNA-binding FadR family transcriptional regulator
MAADGWWKIHGEEGQSAEWSPQGRRDGRAVGLSAAQVSDQLREQIHRGELGPGEWLREARLCAEFEVGRSIARRALRNLAEDGLVVLEAHHRASVGLGMQEPVETSPPRRRVGAR